MYQKKVTTLIALAAASVLLAACSGAPPGGSQTPMADEEGPVTLQVTALERPFMKDVIAKFEQDHPNVTVTFTNQMPKFEDGSVQTILRSGGGPDVLELSAGPARVGQLIKNGLIPEINEIYSEENLTANLRPYVLKQLDAYSEGKYSEVVSGIDVFQVYYNKAIFARLGLAEPKTWEEFLHICAAVKDGGVLPIVAGFRDNLQGGWMFGNIVQAVAGTQAMTEVIYGDGKFDQPALIRAAQTLSDFVDKGYIDGGQASALGSDQSMAAFFQGRGAMTVLGQTHLIRAETNDKVDISQFGSFLMPSPNPGQAPAATAGLGTSWVMNPTSHAPKASRDWLRWVASEEYVTMALKSGGFNSVPARKLPAGVSMGPMLDAASNNVDEAGYNPSVFLPAKAVAAWYQAPQAIVTKQKTPKQAMAEIQSALSQAKAAG